MKHGYPATLLTCLALCVPVGGYASSDEAWEQLRRDLRAACTDLAERSAPGSEIDLRLNEFGSDSYAAALVTAETAQGQELSVCIFDKQTGVAQLTTAFPDASE
ncbi:hypothetical protein [Paracoccus sp. R86501]|uniref:hypothetical protein n=1 Tax=Paracoccus sp. R86501 TaxID=3101711 RepID=UPI00366DA98D